MAFFQVPAAPKRRKRGRFNAGRTVKIQAYTLAYSDAYLAIALVAAFACILIAFMKPMKIYFMKRDDVTK